ncbi:hypothetical protein ACF3OH_01900 [Chryseomicrobium aureum]|uniref:hypothetical protein n=1 Tax=Chryseomicrobium aureum TaxID=1441723 RepID=UPI00370DBC00
MGGWTKTQNGYVSKNDGSQPDGQSFPANQVLNRTIVRLAYVQAIADWTGRLSRPHSSEIE